MNDNQRKSYGIAAGACFVIITQLATRDRLTDSQLAAIKCFSISLPIFVGAVSIPAIRELEQGDPMFHLVDQLVGSALIIFWIGMFALLSSFGWTSGVFFILTSTVILSAYAYIANRK
jgi:hypothetical protein